MATAQFISVDEYLHTSFEYDAEYVEGKIVQRPLPQKNHSRMQGNLYSALTNGISASQGYVWIDQRIQTKRNPARFRVPDLCVTFEEPDEQVFTTPPFLCVEILSRDDSALELRSKIAEYLSFGVSYVWVIDPASETGEIHTPEGIERIDDGPFAAGPLAIDLGD
jgi:Uma2 family endonuclease